MNETAKCRERRDEDRLRLIGLSRIPVCKECRRFESLRAVYTNGGKLDRPLPPVPPACAPPMSCRSGAISAQMAVTCR